MLYEMTVPYSIKALRNLSHILDKGVAHAESKKFDYEVFLNSRLAPDQFPLARQIQIACDTAKLGASRLTGKPAPVHDDKEKSLPEFKKRIEETIQFLSNLTVKDYEGAGQRKITNPRWENKHLTGEDYVHHHVLPNLYFHVTAAYMILRHNGVDLGKKDFLGELPFKSN